MTSTEPTTTTLGKDFSDPTASARPWSEASTVLEKAEIYWISTVRPDGRPHVTPLIALFLDEALYFATGPMERKARNLAEDPRCVITTGNNLISEGFDIVAEGKARRVADHALLDRLSALYQSKYDWDFERGDRFFNDASGEAYVFELRPETAFGFGKGDPFSQTRWRFEAAAR